jgi:hypothetical protein
LNLASNTPALLLDFQTLAGNGDTLQSFSYMGQTGQLLLTVTHRQQDYLLKITPGSPDPPVRLPARELTRAGVWLNGTNGGAAYLCPKPGNNSLMVQSDTFGDSVRLFAKGNVEAFTASADGRRLFIVGVNSNEPAPGIWQYDVLSRRLNCVVPWTERASPDARRVDAQHGTFTLPSGRKVGYYLYLPAGFNRHSARKYPLLIGCTAFGIANRLFQNRPHGPLWAQAVADCGAYVVIVDRQYWFKGIEQWGENVMGGYELLVKNPTIDRQRVFLFAASAETKYLSEVMVGHPSLWRGALLLNPTALPELSGLPRGQPGPRMLMSLGELEHGEERMKRYQQEALRYGAPVEFVVHKGATHWLQSKPAVYERTQAMIRFLFDE